MDPDNRIVCLSAAHLRLLALGLMLLDHTGRVLFPAQIWMVCLGRLAFPIFAFQTAEGYRHTHDFQRYCLRLAAFGAISEIPFNLLRSGALLFPAHQNVMLTLLLGLMCCRAYDSRKWLIMVLWLLAGAFTRCDYGAAGIWTVLTFHAFRGEKPTLLLMLLLINAFGFSGVTLMVGPIPIPVQAFAVLAWLPIALYRGEKGPGGRALQYGSYLFYPLHMLLLWFLSIAK